MNSEILNHINKNGFVKIPSLKNEELINIINFLGKPFHRSEIKVEENSKKFFKSNKELDLHSDNPNAKFVLLYCVQQSEKGGETSLLDLNPFFNNLSVNEIEIYKEIAIPIPFYKFSVPVSKTVSEFIYSNDGYYFLPWVILPLNSTKNILAIDKLKSYIDHSIKIEFKLKSNDLLIIDNKRMLHGRKKIIENSYNRNIIRIWIQ